ncbi:MAG: asparagine synthetase B [Candidatus Woesearchaeota archaeon]
MCGIIGVAGSGEALHLVRRGMKEIEHRGMDGSSYETGSIQGNDYALGHCLHSMDGDVRQPLRRDDKEGEDNRSSPSIFTSNCEIYNWKELDRKHSLKARNDSEALFRLLQKSGAGRINKTLELLDGVYAFAYMTRGKLVLARDIIGVKPLWCSYLTDYKTNDKTDDESGNKGQVSVFAFASEGKALKRMGFTDIKELDPRKMLTYDVSKGKISFRRRAFFSARPVLRSSRKRIETKTAELASEAVMKRLPEKKFGLLFSGGVDSGFLALLLKRQSEKAYAEGMRGAGRSFTCYTAAFGSGGMKEAEDLRYAKRAAKLLGLKLRIVKIKERDIEKHLKRVMDIIEDDDVMKIGVALPFYLACREAKKDGCRAIFSGLGSEEIFGGYERHAMAAEKKSGKRGGEKSGKDKGEKNGTDSVNEECLKGLLKMHERDTYRDDTVAMHNNLELRLPFLDRDLVKYALKIPGRYKISHGQTKMILREAALREGLDRETAMRKKRAAQYGSNSHKVMRKLARKRGFRRVSDYVGALRGDQEG